MKITANSIIFGEMVSKHDALILTKLYKALSKKHKVKKAI